MQLLEGNGGRLYLQAGGGTNESQESAALDEERDKRSAGGGRGMRQQLDQDGQRDLEGVDLGLGSDLQVQGMQQLSQDERSQELLEHQHRGRSPPQVQPQLAFEQFEGEFDIPSAGGQAPGGRQGGQGAVPDRRGGATPTTAPPQLPPPHP